jgi:hypothetical protein
MDFSSQSSFDVESDNDQLCNKIQEVLDQIATIESVTSNPAGYINDLFDLNKKHINWRRDDLVFEINRYTEKLIEENESNRLKCLESIEEARWIAQRIEASKQEGYQLKNNFEVHRTNDDKDDLEFHMFCIENTAECLSHNLNLMLKEYQDSLRLNKEHLFIFFDRPMEYVVGKIIDKKSVRISFSFLEFLFGNVILLLLSI